jgi:beta-lactamase superfamily II metal-dependent hydrolase
MPATLQAGDVRAEVTMLPVAAGDATLIMWSDGGSRHTVLIDAGLRENEAASYLQSIGIFHLDLVILSHPDLDH